MPHTTQAFFRFLSSTTSTNDVAKDLLCKHYPTPLIVIAETQTNGKGRFNNSWESQSKNNFYGSFGFALKENFSNIQLLPIWIAHHLCKALNDTFQLSLQTKWPNDIVFQQKKVAGILMESTTTQDQVKHLVVGIGLNINSTLNDFSQQLAGKVTSLQIIKQSQLDHQTVARTIIHHTLQSYQAFFARKHTQFPKTWQTLEHTFQKQLKITVNGQELSAQITGLTQNGHLVLTQSDQTTFTLRPDQISPFDGYSLSNGSAES